MKTILSVLTLFAALSASADPSCRGAYFDGHSYNQEDAVYIQLGALPFNQTVKVPGRQQRQVLLSYAADTFQLSLTEGQKVLGISRVENRGIHASTTKIELEVGIEGFLEKVEAFCIIN